MKKTTKTESKPVIGKGHTEIFKKALRDYKKLHEEVAPFIKKRITHIHPTGGQWQESSQILLDQEMDNLTTLE